MNLARVVGTVVTSVRSDSLDAPRFLLVELCDETGKGTGTHMVSLDFISARQGDMVFVCQGSSCRWTFETDNQPIDILIAGIVDRIDTENDSVYHVG